LRVSFFIFFSRFRPGNHLKIYLGGELAGMSGGKLLKASNSKKKLSERVKIFEVLIFF